MLAVVGIGLSALIIALTPSFLGILAAKLLHVGASSILGPAIAAITLGLVGHAAVGPRLGRNARFASIGNGLAAAVMGICGYLISPQAVFLVTAALALPTLLALAEIEESAIDSALADGGIADREATAVVPALIGRLLRKRSLLVLTFAIFLFHAANAAMLPLVGSEMAMRSGHLLLPLLGIEISMGQWASALIALCIVVPQGVVALIAPGVGRLAVNWGRRPVLLLGFAALPLRAAVLAFNSDPWVIVAAQILDGVCGAVLGVLVPLSLADISRGTGRFNLAQGIAASATGVGAALSTAVAGYLASKFGSGTAFFGLAVTAAAAFLTLLVAMPETARDNIDGPPANRMAGRTL
jgi:predicted MFS family arabinose efflux permease